MDRTRYFLFFPLVQESFLSSQSGMENEALISRLLLAHFLLKVRIMLSMAGHAIEAKSLRASG